MTSLSLNWLRYLGHDTLGCEASPLLCRLQLNNSKVTGIVLQAQQALITLAKLTLPRKGGLTKATIMRIGLSGLKW
jgi:hypothetical protein